jgi:hypothetical protein
MTVLLLMVPPALCSVSPKTAKKMIGAITDLKAKKYWTLVVLVRFTNVKETDGDIIPWCKEYIGREAEAGSKAQSHTFLPW